LLASVALRYLMLAAGVVEPGLNGGGTGDLLTWPGFDGQEGCGCMAEIIKTFRARPRAEPKLVREACCLEGCGEVLHQCWGDEALEDVAHNQGPHAAIRLT